MKFAVITMEFGTVRGSRLWAFQRDGKLPRALKCVIVAYEEITVEKCVLNQEFVG